MIAIHVTVEGRVQGVGYRAWVKREADAVGLTGWVRNRADGSVEAVFCGEPDVVRAMVEACQRGPSFARVSRLATAMCPPTAAQTFDVLQTE